jgi:hypothetical protein
MYTSDVTHMGKYEFHTKCPSEFLDTLEDNIKIGFEECMMVYTGVT